VDGTPIDSTRAPMPRVGDRRDGNPVPPRLLFNHVLKGQHDQT
jgi:hypothetical protein